MQRVVWTETVVQGPKSFADVLAQPEAVRNFYQDIAVLAMPAPEGKARIRDIQGKSSVIPQHFPPQRAKFASLPADSVIPRNRILDLTGKMDASGKLAWDVPEGKWLILRLGHTTTGTDNHPAPASGCGLECDKLSKEAAETHFNALMGRLVADNRPLAGKGKVLVSTHIDSWETGSQNWTPRMREEFRKRRGYDILPLLPTFTGRVVDSLEVSERFLWDLRQTVSEMLMENYAGHFRTLANRHGLRLSIEAYDGVPCDEMTYGGQADEPMAEFWSWDKFGAAYSCTEMSSAAHVYGKPILGAEAFTATDNEKWLGHPAYIKDLGDWAFCEGINRFVFHRYAMQPWTNPNRARHVDGPLGPALRADADLVGAIQGLARIPGPLPVPVAARAVRRRRLLPAARGRPAALRAPAHGIDGPVRPRRLQLRRLHAGSGPHAHEREGWPHRAARRHELPPARAAPGRNDDAGPLGQDQGAGRSRGHGRSAVASTEIARFDRLPGLRSTGQVARRRSLGHRRSAGGRHRAASWATAASSGVAN